MVSKNNFKSFWIEKPRWIEEPYYDEWAYTFLIEGTQQNGVVDREHLEEVRVWLTENATDRCYMVGQRVSFMALVDAMAFKIRWG